MAHSVHSDAWAWTLENLAGWGWGLLIVLLEMKHWLETEIWR